MRYSEVIKKLNYWKKWIDKEDPEIVINDVPYSYEIVSIQPVKGIGDVKAIGLICEEKL